MNRLKRPTKIYISIMLVFATIALMSAHRGYAAKTMTDIRVGLVDLYGDCPKITIYNSKLAFGYSKNNSYKAIATLTGDNGFTFAPASGYFCISKDTYESFEAAEKAAKRYRKKGVKAFPAILGPDTYKVYVSGSDSKDGASADKEKCSGVKGELGSPTNDNGEKIKVVSTDFEFVIDGSAGNAYPQFKALTKNGSASHANLGSRKYRGRIEIGRYGKKGVSAVNIVNIEAYLCSVVPCEMVSSWHTEALKAQAVVARSFCIASAGYGCDSDIKTPYKIVDTTASQVYKGSGYEAATTTAAVLATKGEVARYNGEVLKTYFFSTSGGSTEDISNVWGSGLACYKGVPDIYETVPEKAPWLVKTTLEEIGEKMRDSGYDVGTVKNVYNKIRTQTGRNLVFAVKDSEKTVLVEKGKIRSVLGLYSTKIKIVKPGSKPDTVYAKSRTANKEITLSGAYMLQSGDRLTKGSDTGLEQYIVMGSDNMMNFGAKAPSKKGEVYIYGMGYGHGVGLSQSGARGMAEAGFSYKRIVEYYFTGAVCG